MNEKCLSEKTTKKSMTTRAMLLYYAALMTSLFAERYCGEVVRGFYESNDVDEDDRKKEERNTKVPIECDNSSVCFYTP